MSPSDKERVDIFIGLLDKKLETGDAKGFTARQLIEIVNSRGGAFGFATREEIRELPAKDLGLLIYDQFPRTLVFNSSLSSDYFNEVKKRGYNCLVDDMDAKFMSDTPIMVFDADQNVKEVERRKLPISEVAYALKNTPVLPFETSRRYDYRS